MAEQQIHDEAENGASGEAAANGASAGSKVAVTQEALEDGTLIGLYKAMYMGNKCEETLFPFMSCLHDAYAIMPMNVEKLSHKEIEALRESETAGEMDVDMESRLVPELLQGEGMQAWLPVFTTVNEIPQDYLEEHEFVTGRVLDCIEVAHSYEELTGIVLDPFTSPMEMPFKIADLLETVPGILEIASRAEAEDPAEGGAAADGNPAAGDVDASNTPASE